LPTFAPMGSVEIALAVGTWALVLVTWLLGRRQIQIELIGHSGPGWTATPVTGRPLTMTTLTQCTFDGRTAATRRPLTDGWTFQENCAAGIRDGWYCPAHSPMIDALHGEGVFDDPENDLPC
jgi:hypothetical protein